MDSIVKADIFFFVTTIAVVVVSIILCVALIYTIRILRDVKSLSTKAKDEGERILEDVRAFREGVGDTGFRMTKTILSFFGLSGFKPRTRNKKEE